MPEFRFYMKNFKTKNGNVLQKFYGDDAIMSNKCVLSEIRFLC